MKTIFLSILVAIGVSLTAGTVTHAGDSIQMRPLLYKETLTPGQTKRGAIDIANASTAKVSLHVSVKFFRQIDDNGTLQFYEKPDEAAAIVPEYTDFDLEAKEAMRLIFTVDSAKLPQGDVFAVIMVSTQNKSESGKQAITPNVQLGTLLILQNGAAGPRHAELSQLSLLPVQIGGAAVKGKVDVTNPADPDTSTGFFPQMKARVEPWGASTHFDGPLVYAGRTRTVDFSVPSDQFGIYKVTIGANDTTVSQYVFLMTGKWTWLAPVALGALTLCIIGITYAKKSRRHSTASRQDGSSSTGKKSKP